MRLGREYEFAAAHYLPNHPKCGSLHGHTYVVRLKISVPPIPDITVDFAEIDHVMKPIISQFDHSNLNDFFEMPTAEQLALYIFEKLRNAGYNTVAVRVYETSKSFAEVSL